MRKTRGSGRALSLPLRSFLLRSVKLNCAGQQRQVSRASCIDLFQWLNALHHEFAHLIVKRVVDAIETVVDASGIASIAIVGHECRPQHGVAASQLLKPLPAAFLTNTSLGQRNNRLDDVAAGVIEGAVFSGAEFQLVKQRRQRLGRQDRVHRMLRHPEPQQRVLVVVFGVLVIELEHGEEDIDFEPEGHERLCCEPGEAGITVEIDGGEQGKQLVNAVVSIAPSSDPCGDLDWCG